MLKMTRKDVMIFILSVIAGIAVWLFFLMVLKMEPWDSPYGAFTMLGIGLLLGLFAPQKPWLWPIGLSVGQFLFCIKYFFFPATANGVNFFFPIGMISLVFFCGLAFVTSFIGSGVRMAAHKLKEKFC